MRNQSILKRRQVRSNPRISLWQRFRCTWLLLGLMCFGGRLAIADSQTNWMLPGKFGLFMHYQYRILLGWGGPFGQGPLSQETLTGFNNFVNGFDTTGFANQVAQAQIGWVIFGIDDSEAGWQCAPNATLDGYTAPNKFTATRDLISDLSVALHAKGIKLICYWDGCDGYFRQSEVYGPLGDDGNQNTAPSDTCRQRRLSILQEYCNRYGTAVDGWWFDGSIASYYNTSTYNYSTIVSYVRTGNPNGVITFSWGAGEFSDMATPSSAQDYLAGDTYQTGSPYAPQLNLMGSYLPSNQGGAAGNVWAAKIYCGNMYHGIGDGLLYTDSELETWIQTCNSQGGICTIDYPFDYATGHIKDFAMTQLTNIGHFLKGGSNASGGTLSGSVVLGSTSTYNLSTMPGAVDWAHWNGIYTNGTGVYTHKASGDELISNLSPIGGGTYGIWHSTSRNVSWTDGSGPATGGNPDGVAVASNSDDQNYVWCNSAANSGWTFAAPADTTSRTLSVLYGGAVGTPVTIKAHLSDGSATDYTFTQTISSTTLNLATFTYTAASANQGLQITLTTGSSQGNGTSVDLDAAWLISSGGPSQIWDEAENLAVAAQTAGITARVGTDTNMSAGAGAFFDATATGQFVTYDVPNVAVATYDVRIGVKDWNNKGQWQLAISRLDQQGSATNVGPVVDEYTANATYGFVDLGNWTPGSTSDKAFKFTVVGKNASSSAYGIDVDYIELIPQ